MKIGVFKLNWIEQSNLKLEMHSGKKKRRWLSIDPSAIDNGYLDTPDRDCAFDSLSTWIEQLSTAMAQSVDSCGSVCRQSWLNLRVG